MTDEYIKAREEMAETHQKGADSLESGLWSYHKFKAGADWGHNYATSELQAVRNCVSKGLKGVRSECDCGDLLSHGGGCKHCDSEYDLKEALSTIERIMGVKG